MYTTEKLDNNKYQIKITISPEEWEKYVNQAYEENKGKFNVQGFRKGKAPRKVIEQNYGANVFFDDAIDIGFSKEYYDCLTKEKEIEPIDNPELKIEKFDEKLGLLLDTLQQDDLLIITADHGNDPTYTGTDHTREKVPFLAYSKKITQPKQLPETDSFAVIGATIAENFGVPMPEHTIGESLLSLLI